MNDYLPETALDEIAEAELACIKETTAKSFQYGKGSFEITNGGVCFIELDSEGNESERIWVCSELRATSETRDTASSDWGRTLEWKDPDGIIHKWAVPLELLQGDGSEVRRELARQGLKISTSKKARDLMIAYIQVAPVQARSRCVNRLGWHGSIYVRPSESIGLQSESVVFQNAHPIEPAFEVSGTPESWRDTVGRMAMGNSRLLFSISAAFAPTLADIAGEDSGGFHIVGGSSTGKTSALKAAASVWGCPNKYPCTWRATSNGLEGLAAIHNDGLLILDELSQCDPREAGESAYLLGNGQGKARASRNGTARKPARWRLFFLSAGEESIRSMMQRAGKRTNAGQEIRLAEIEADAGGGMGLFEYIHKHPNPSAFALALKDAATQQHGAVGVEWLHHVVADRSGLAEFIHSGLSEFTQEYCPQDADGQAVRVARRFGLVAIAGELATEYGLTGWNQGDAQRATGQCYLSWMQLFGGAGNKETRNILGHVKAFVEANASSRFEDIDSDGNQKIINQAGFTRLDEFKNTEYLVLTSVFHKEICSGFDKKKVTQVLADAGWLVPGKDNRPSQKPRIPGKGTPRVYVLNNKLWEAEV